MLNRTGGICALALLFLTGCDKPITRAEAENIAEDYAPDTSALESRISELEAEVRRLDQEQSKDISVLAEMSKADMIETREVNAELKRLSDNGDAFNQQINILRADRGWPPMNVKK